jgi:hypothetical protein
MSPPERGPGPFGVVLGSSWIVLCVTLTGFMVSAYVNWLGAKGLFLAVGLLPFAALAYPFISLYYAGFFPWLWTLGLVLAVCLGVLILGER